MAIVSQRKTARFELFFDDALTGAQALAQSLGDHIENDFHHLLAYIPFDNEAPGNAFEKHPTFVYVISQTSTGIPNFDVSGIAPGSAANANAYISTLTGSGQIGINVRGADGALLNVDFARFLFIAEMAEQLMPAYAYVPGGNNTGAARGEAVSRIMAEELFPAQAYDPQSVSPAPWVNQWLNSSPRPDYINVNPSPTSANPNLGGDLDQVGYGCGILFFNYLRYQLGFSASKIITAGGTKWADNYKNLTDRTDDPLAAMNTLLDRHLPAFNINLLTNNPFPLYEGTARSVFVKTTLQKSGQPDPFIGLNQTVHISPFHGCPAKDYHYSWEHWSLTNTIEASSIGFIDPTYQWKIGTTTLFAATGTFFAAVEVFIPHPDGSPETYVGLKTVQFRYAITEVSDRAGKRSQIAIANLDFPGRFLLPLTVDANETNAFEGPTSVGTAPSFDTHTVQYEQAYYIDRLRCATRDIVANIPVLIKTVANIPRPGPQEIDAVVRYLGAIERVRAEIASMPSHDRPAIARAAEFAAISTGFPAHLFAPRPSRTDNPR